MLIFFLKNGTFPYSFSFSFGENPEAESYESYAKKRMPMAFAASSQLLYVIDLIQLDVSDNKGPNAAELFDRLW